jgi:hypothetical protein
VSGSSVPSELKQKFFPWGEGRYGGHISKVQAENSGATCGQLGKDIWTRLALSKLETNTEPLPSHAQPPPGARLPHSSASLPSVNIAWRGGRGSVWFLTLLLFWEPDSGPHGTAPLAGLPPGLPALDVYPGRTHESGDILGDRRVPGRNSKGLCCHLAPHQSRN